MAGQDKLTKVVPQPLNKAIVDFSNGVNADIIGVLESDFNTYWTQCRDVGKVFKGMTVYETAYRVWHFLRAYANYKRDPDDNQLIRVPAYFVHNGYTGDCKTFALFARCVMAAIYPNIETAFAYTAYDPERKKPSHVYTKVLDENNNVITIDGCWGSFNGEKKYTFMLPLKFKSMQITTLAGVDNGLGWVPKEAFNRGKKIPQHKVRAVVTHINKTLPYKKRKRIVDLVKLRNAITENKKLLSSGKIDIRTYNENKQRIAARLKQLRVVHAPINGPKKKKRKKGKLAQRRAEILAEYKRIKKLPKNQRKAARKALRKKINKEIGKDLKKGFIAIGRGLNTAALAPIRGAFLAVVAMNVNGFASNLKILYDLYKSGKDKEGWRKVVEIWKNVGGFEKILVKTIEKGAKNKKLFMSKKAAARWKRNHKGINGPGDDIVIYEGRNAIGHPAVIAAAIAAATGIIGALIPVIMQALKRNGKEQEANEVAQQGADLVEDTKQGKTYQQAFQGNNEGVVPQIAPEAAEEYADNTAAEEDTSPDELPEPQPYNEGDEMQGESPEALEGIYSVMASCHGGEGVGAMDADTTASLISNLSKVVGAGLDFTQTVIKKKAAKNPKLKKVLEQGSQVADTIVSNSYVKGGGVVAPVLPAPKPVRRKTTNKGSSINKTLLYAGGGLLLGLGVVKLLKK